MALKKYYRAACIVAGDTINESGPENSPEEMKKRIDGMVRIFRRWVDDFALAPMGDYGFTEENLRSCAAGAGLKGTPVSLSGEDLRYIALSSVRA